MKLPNILITGTPGTGKSAHCERLMEMLSELDPATQGECPFRLFNVGQLVKDKDLHNGQVDQEFSALVIDEACEEKILDELEGPIAEGGVIVDHHSCGFFPERFFQLVVVLRADNSILYPRLEARGYDAKKIDENMEAEIMQVVLDEAKESYAEGIVVELQSDSIDALEENCKKIVQWVQTYVENQRKLLQGGGGAGAGSGATEMKG